MGGRARLSRIKSAICPRSFRPGDDKYLLTFCVGGLLDNDFLIITYKGLIF